MELLLSQIEKAKARGAGIDLRALSDYARDKRPIELSSPEQLAQRSFAAARPVPAAQAKHRPAKHLALLSLEDIVL